MNPKMYTGIGWYAAEVAIPAELLAATSSGILWYFATAGAAVSSMQVFVDGVHHNGDCNTSAICASGVTVGLPSSAVQPGKHVIVIRVNASDHGGLTRRLYLVGRNGTQTQCTSGEC